MTANLATHCLVYRDAAGDFQATTFRDGAWSALVGNGLESYAVQAAARMATAIPVTITDQPIDLCTLTLDDLDEVPSGYECSMIVPQSRTPGATDYVLVRFGSQGDIVVSGRFDRKRAGEALGNQGRTRQSVRMKHYACVQMVRHDVTGEELIGQTIPGDAPPILISLPRVPRPTAADLRAAQLHRKTTRSAA